MQIDQEFKDFNNEINNLRNTKKIDDYQYYSLLTMKLIQNCLKSIDYKLNDILNKIILK